VAQQFRGAIVGVGKPPLIVERVERVRDASEDLAQFGLEFVLAALEAAFLFFERCDVFAGGDDSLERAVRPEDGNGRDGEPRSVTGRVLDDELLVTYRLAGRSDARRGTGLGIDRLAVRIEDVQRGEQLGLAEGIAVAESQFGLRVTVRQHRLAVGVFDRDRDRCGLEERFGLVPLTFERPFAADPVEGRLETRGDDVREREIGLIERGPLLGADDDDAVGPEGKADLALDRRLRIVDVRLRRHVIVDRRLAGIVNVPGDPLTGRERGNFLKQGRCRLGPGDGLERRSLRFIEEDAVDLEVEDVEQVLTGLLGDCFARPGLEPLANGLIQPAELVGASVLFGDVVVEFDASARVRAGFDRFTSVFEPAFLPVLARRHVTVESFGVAVVIVGRTERLDESIRIADPLGDDLIW